MVLEVLSKVKPYEGVHTSLLKKKWEKNPQIKSYTFIELTRESQEYQFSQQIVGGISISFEAADEKVNDLQNSLVVALDIHCVFSSTKVNFFIMKDM